MTTFSFYSFRIFQISPHKKYLAGFWRPPLGGAWGSCPPSLRHCTWGMKFNAKKCNIMQVSRSRKPLQHFYSLGNEILQEVSDPKYLGIQIDITNLTGTSIFRQLLLEINQN